MSVHLTPGRIEGMWKYYMYMYVSIGARKLAKLVFRYEENVIYSLEQTDS